MTSPVLNVARYSALVGGIGYGIVHRRTIQKREDLKAAIAEKQYQEKVQEDKRREQDNRMLAAFHSGSGSGGVVSDPDSPQFDLEKYLKSLEK